MSILYLKLYIPDDLVSALTQAILSASPAVFSTWTWKSYAVYGVRPIISLCIANPSNTVLTSPITQGTLSIG